MTSFGKCIKGEYIVDTVVVIYYMFQAITSSLSACTTLTQADACGLAKLGPTVAFCLLATMLFLTVLFVPVWMTFGNTRMEPNNFNFT